MKEWQGVSAPDGTLLRYRDNGETRIGVLQTDETYQRRFSDVNPKAKITYWVISQWEMYDIVTESEAALYLLENA